MNLRYVSNMRQLTSDEKRELQNLMDESGMFYGKKLEEFVEPEEFKSAIFVSNKHGNVCGFAFIEDEEYSIALSHLYVEPAVRRHGVASALVKCVKSFAKQKKIERVELAVGKENVQAKALYEKEGFEVQRTHDDKFIMSAQVKTFDK